MQLQKFTVRQPLLKDDIRYPEFCLSSIHTPCPHLIFYEGGRGWVLAKQNIGKQQILKPQPFEIIFFLAAYLIPNS